MMFLKLHQGGKPLLVNPYRVDMCRKSPRVLPGDTDFLTSVYVHGNCDSYDETLAEIEQIINHAAGRPGVWSLDRARAEQRDAPSPDEIGRDAAERAWLDARTREVAYRTVRKVWKIANGMGWTDDHPGGPHVNLGGLGEALDKSFPGWRKADSAPADPDDEDEAEGPWVRARQQADADEWEPDEDTDFDPAYGPEGPR